MQSASDGRGGMMMMVMVWSSVPVQNRQTVCPFTARHRARNVRVSVRRMVSVQSMVSVWSISTEHDVSTEHQYGAWCQYGEHDVCSPQAEAADPLQCDALRSRPCRSGSNMP
eukprot:61163-Rhodomonas_salina.1